MLRSVTCNFPTSLCQDFKIVMTEILRLFIELKLLLLNECVLLVFSPILDCGAVNPKLIELIESEMS